MLPECPLADVGVSIFKVTVVTGTVYNFNSQTFVFLTQTRKNLDNVFS